MTERRDHIRENASAWLIAAVIFIMCMAAAIGLSAATVYADDERPELAPVPENVEEIKLGETKTVQGVHAGDVVTYLINLEEGTGLTFDISSSSANDRLHMVLLCTYNGEIEYRVLDETFNGTKTKTRWGLAGDIFGTYYLQIAREGSNAGSSDIKCSVIDEGDWKKNGIEVHSSDEAVQALLAANRDLEETVVLKANPDEVKIKGSREGWATLDDAIDSGFYAGLKSRVEGRYEMYDKYADMSIFAGPSLDDSVEDPSDDDYMLYMISLEYHTDKDELRVSDQKLNTIIAQSGNVSDAEKLKAFYNWMKKNVPEEKDSDTGYTRNCNGLYGCLFGDGTGYACHTYAATIQRFCELAGIKACMIGDAGDEVYMSHIYNMVELNGKWYAFDYTRRDDDFFLVGINRLRDSSDEKMITTFFSEDELAGPDMFEEEKAEPAVTPSEPEATTEQDTQEETKPVEQPQVTPVAPAEPTVPVGTTKAVAAGTVEVTSAEAKTVEFTAAKNKKSVTVPATVKIDGKTYKVTTVDAAAFKGSKIRSVTIGKNVDKIEKNAFKGSKVTTLTIKSKSLDKGSVKGSLKGSKVKTVKVKVGNKKENKTYVKKYKKIFTKVNAGKKVKVK